MFILLLLVSATASMERFSEWMREYKMQYNESHLPHYFEKWTKNDMFIERFDGQFMVGHNQFSAMDSRDFKELLNLKYEPRQRTKVYSAVQVPSYVNWVEAGAVTGVKDQQQCGSCWSFSATGATEGAYFNKYGTLLSFSEQQLVDCDNLKHGGKDHGCNGGLMDNAFEWISKNGICEESAYPYTGTGDSCKSCAAATVLTSWVDVQPTDNAMMAALARQPVSIAIEADQPEFQLYKSGVYTGKCGTNLDHGVLAVGYDTDYYLVKNSWGTTWGEGGYIKLGRGDYNKGEGQCGMLLQASYPVI